MLNNRPISPQTRALMCDEKDMMLEEALLPNGAIKSCQNTLKLSNGHGCREDYAEQERRVLTGFRDCLSRLITRGSIRGSSCGLLFLPFLLLQFVNAKGI